MRRFMHQRAGSMDGQLSQEESGDENDGDVRLRRGYGGQGEQGDQDGERCAEMHA